MTLKIVRNDITKMNTEAIVNIANSFPVVSEGCEKAIYEVAGYEMLLEQRKKVGEKSVGEAFLTPGFSLVAKYIIHAVSPRYVDGNSGEEEKLRACYQNVLQIAIDNHITSIAFPLIATGSYGYPREEGLRIAVEEINSFLEQYSMEIYLVVFDQKMTELGKKRYPDLETYISQNYVEEKSAKANWDGQAEKDTAISKKEKSRLWDLFSAKRSKSASEKRNFSGAAKTGAAKPSTFGRTHFDASMQEAKSSTKQEPVPMLFSMAQPKPQAENVRATLADRPTNKPGKKLAEPETTEVLEEAEILEYTEALEDTEVLEDVEMLEEMSSDGLKASAESREDEAISGLEKALSERMKHMTDTYQEYLFYLIESKGMTNAEIYKRAIVDKKVFSKIKNNPDYHPNKMTALCLCVGAKLNLDETKDLLARAGYALSPCDKTDIIFSYFIENEIYDMIEIDIQLEEYGLPCVIS